MEEQLAEGYTLAQIEEMRDNNYGMPLYDEMTVDSIKRHREVTTPKGKEACPAILDLDGNVKKCKEHRWNYVKREDNSISSQARCVDCRLVGILKVIFQEHPIKGAAKSNK